MAQPSFKDLLNTFTLKQYSYLERPLNVFLSSVLTLYMVYWWQPLTDIVYDGFSNRNMFYIQAALLIMGAFLIFKTKLDEFRGAALTDSYGFQFINKISSDSTQFPI